MDERDMRSFPYSLSWCVRERYLASHGGGPRISEHPDGRCVFYGDDGCAVYAVRPRQCRTFPFWVRNLRSAERWGRVAAACPGIGAGRRYSKERILEILSREA